MAAPVQRSRTPTGTGAEMLQFKSANGSRASRRWAKSGKADLLSRRVRKPGQDAGFGHGGIAFIFQDAADRNAFMTKGAQQHPSGLVVPDHSHRQDIHPEIGQIVDRIRAATGNYFAVMMLQNQNGSLARDPGDFAKYKFVRDQIREHRHGELGKRFNDLAQAQAAVVFRVNMLRHRSSVMRGNPRFSHERGISSRVLQTLPPPLARMVLVRIAFASSMGWSNVNVRTAMASGFSSAWSAPRFTASFSVVRKPL